MKPLRVVLSVTGVLVLLSIGANSARAEGESLPEVRHRSYFFQADMIFEIVTRENAERFGFEIRTDDHGVEYSVTAPSAQSRSLSANHTFGSDTVVGHVSRTKEWATHAGQTCGIAGIVVRSREKFTVFFVLRRSAGVPTRFAWSATSHLPGRDDVAYRFDVPDRVTRVWMDSRRVSPPASFNETLVATFGGYMVTAHGVCAAPEMMASRLFVVGSRDRRLTDGKHTAATTFP